jgi:hypothetical protein
MTTVPTLTLTREVYSHYQAVSLYHRRHTHAHGTAHSRFKWGQFNALALLRALRCPTEAGGRAHDAPSH